jgi:predicted CoA-substrate-specific enzyme activase
MICVGCDVGAMATKTAIMRDNQLIGWDVTLNQGRLAEVAEESLAKALDIAGVPVDALDQRVGTGWGQKYIGYPHRTETMINCLARAAVWTSADIRTVVDLGGLSTTVISLSPEGRVLEYRNNDRCASGTGFFIDLAAQALEMELEHLDLAALNAEKRAYIGAQCAVFGESEIVSHVNDGVEPTEIAAGVTHSIGVGAATTVLRLGANQEILATGGVAKLKSVIESLAEKLGVDVRPPEVDPQLAAAIGAALSGALT